EPGRRYFFQDQDPCHKTAIPRGHEDTKVRSGTSPRTIGPRCTTTLLFERFTKCLRARDSGCLPVVFNGSPASGAQIDGCARLHEGEFKACDHPERFQKVEVAQVTDPEKLSLEVSLTTAYQYAKPIFHERLHLGGAESRRRDERGSRVAGAVREYFHPPAGNGRPRSARLQRGVERSEEATSGLQP